MAGNEKYLAIHFDRLCSVQANEKRGVKEQPSIPKSVHLIDCLEKESDEQETEEERDSFSFSERHIVIKGEFDLTPGHSEDEIRNELVDLDLFFLPFPPTPSRFHPMITSHP